MGRRDRWWFLLKGEEAVLMELESMWDKVALQTNWKIQSCTMPQTNAHSSTEESQNAFHETNGGCRSDHQMTIGEESLTTVNVTADDSDHFLVDSQPLPTTST